MERQYCEPQGSSGNSHATTNDSVDRESGHNSLM